LAELQVLQGEPRHKVETFVDEVLERSRQVVAQAGTAFEGLLRDIIASFQAFRQAHMLITLDRVRFQWIRWTPDGKLLIGFGLGPGMIDKDMPRHAVVDAFVDDVVGRSVPDELRQEFAGFVRGMVNCLAMLKKWHLDLDLEALRFDRPYWHGDDRTLVIGMRHHGRPLGHREARWD
jgi:hypothetical protein